jgi:DNA-binding NarL/FixJ family response regulator
VLIVDDNADIRRLVRLRLEIEGGFDVLPDASDGAGALVSARRDLPDVVLLDLSMPVMDGLEVLPHLRQALPYVRIVMLSGFDSQRFRDRAIELGADAYVEKGSALDSLVDLLHELTEVLPVVRVPGPRQAAADSAPAAVAVEPAPVPSGAPVVPAAEHASGAA